jgi:hypothetical protein
MEKDTLNCLGCTQYNCKKIRENGGYKYWYCLLELLYGNGNKVFKKSTPIKKVLIKAACEFLPDNKIYNSGGIIVCDAHYGTYIWHFAVRMKQYQLWGLKEFKEGYEFGLNPKEPYRDANPYIEPERNSAWDCGYILGLHEQNNNGE